VAIKLAASNASAQGGSGTVVEPLPLALFTAKPWVTVGAAE
jgi:hypothetical protein